MIEPPRWRRWVGEGATFLYRNLWHVAAFCFLAYALGFVGLVWALRGGLAAFATGLGFAMGAAFGRKMWPRVPAWTFDDGPPVAIPWKHAVALENREFVPLKEADNIDQIRALDEAHPHNPRDPHSRIDFTSEATWYCPICCHTREEKHTRACARGKAFAWLRGVLAEVVR